MSRYQWVRVADGRQRLVDTQAPRRSPVARSHIGFPALLRGATPLNSDFPPEVPIEPLVPDRQAIRDNIQRTMNDYEWGNLDPALTRPVEINLDD